MKFLVKWRVIGLPIIVDSDNIIWREPFKCGLRNYGYKELKFHRHQNKDKILVNNKRYTKEYIKTNICRVNEYHNLPKGFEDLPF
jgi:predicted nucleic-acid-binding Zn-ribbon protein